ncbi:hypothetical protein HRG_004662 [Hirsutella rhossiliensis]|uniref:DNA damage-responsive protein 48 n=1 Tax=Hirsutella rhossiliensis TaxID=111463 RepID=A0A9P8SJI2_9HYPO|nr:uncharacterized protein HRG_04662 [Hirsutella rhossiliensis]KAH0964234.1 hypothetical protein HRG_04662 [Hirsutella rhossiliensis]
MDFLKKATGGGSSDNKDNNQAGQSSAGGGFMDKLNGAAGGGAQGERDEDGLDKAVDMFQEKVLGQGDQSNESAAEQAKDEMISDGIRDQYKKFTGSDFPIKDKEKKVGF